MTIAPAHFHLAIDLDRALAEAEGIGLATALESTYEGTGWHGGVRTVPLVIERGRWATYRAPYLMLMTQAIAAAHGAGEVCRAWIGSCTPGGSIAPHVDEMPLEPRRRFHLPLATNRNALFAFDNERGECEAWEHFPVGVVREIDPLARHAIRNDGRTARVHLVVDAARTDG